MSRLYFRRAPAGFRTARGGLVQRLQRSLEQEGFSPGEADGIFGRDTERALQAWQRARGRPDHGGVDEDTWRALFGDEPPTLFERALQLTAAFEGHGFGKTVGSWDGAWLTWGVIGFTLRFGEVQAILNALLAEHPAVLNRAFGPLMPELLGMLSGDGPQQRAWAEAISVPPRRVRVAVPWAEAFQRLGDEPEAQQAQLKRAGRYWERARRDAQRAGLRSEIGLALCFDVAVQNGGVDEADLRRVRERLGPGRMPERHRRVALAHAVADGSRPEFAENVRSRKLTIATGSGWVHGARYALADWGLVESDPVL